MPNETYSTEENKPTSVIKIDQYYLVVGFEVNVPQAYRNAKTTLSRKIEKHQFMDGNGVWDWGHAFFYIVKNEAVYCFFSYGPSIDKSEAQARGERKTGGGSIIGTSATCQYDIGEVAQLFTVDIDKETADKIKADVDAIYMQTNNYIYNEETEEWERHQSMDKKYRALTNETCAKEAEEILRKHLAPQIPAGMGYVKVKGLSKKAVNPYAWHEKVAAANLNHYTFPEYPNVGRAEKLLAAYNEVDKNGIKTKQYLYKLRTFDVARQLQNEGLEMEPQFNTKSRDLNWYLLAGDEDPLNEHKYR
ncbi:hypothetical protein [Acinetobacter larvae]|uniref:Uncharacterized protein n=1 Tax=Acinetobacter larvae TaxID=1789224 RepID=A0A1B2LWP1_9GAMM|nr:hypothetical protein [Acinetobacter larvae]AOA57355.1 hypothetical protein BFG52_02600 [Acinetobacter larvae]